MNLIIIHMYTWSSATTEMLWFVCWPMPCRGGHWHSNHMAEFGRLKISYNVCYLKIENSDHSALKVMRSSLAFTIEQVAKDSYFSVVDSTCLQAQNEVSFHSINLFKCPLVSESE